MIEARCTKPGTANEFNNSLSKYGVEARAIFRNTAQAELARVTGKFTKAIPVKYGSGYKDIERTARDLQTGPGAIRKRKSPAFAGLRFSDD